MARRRYRAFLMKGIALGNHPDLVGGGLIRSAGDWSAVRMMRKAGLFQKSDERMLKEEFPMDKPYQATPDIVVLPAHFSVPGAGFLPINSFVIKAKEPVLVDAGMGIDSEEFMKALQSVIDPRKLKWVWL
ncbi:MAG: hypothetical protein AB7S77_19870, partial [Desulfatirhabdiaceae bacterium]